MENERLLLVRLWFCYSGMEAVFYSYDLVGILVESVRWLPLTVNYVMDLLQFLFSSVDRLQILLGIK